MSKGDVSLEFTSCSIPTELKALFPPWFCVNVPPDEAYEFPSIPINCGPPN